MLGNSFITPDTVSSEKHDKKQNLSVEKGQKKNRNRMFKCLVELNVERKTFVFGNIYIFSEIEQHSEAYIQFIQFVVDGSE